MQTIPIINKIIQKHYNHFDEDRKRNISILIILVAMMIFVMGSWIFGFFYLGMWEIFWLDLVLWTGFVVLFVGVIGYGWSFKLARFWGLMLTLLITCIPPMYYGLDTVIMIHMVFVPLATILLFSRKERKQFLTYMGGFMICFLMVTLWDVIYGAVFSVPEEIFQIFNTIIALDGLFISLYFSYFFFTENTQYKDLLANEREKSDHLLLSIFPETIAAQLRDSHQSVADSFDNVTILFADIVGFTQYASKMSPSELVAMLDEIFSEFNALVDKYGIEKIKTIGDAYMAVGGLPVPDGQHCQNVANMAIEINEIIKTKYAEKYDLKIRIGIHTGKAVAGVIGNKKFSYDLWGDAVNVASRFESSGHPEKIHITEAVKNILATDFLFEDCGDVAIKGKGMMKSYFLTGKKEMINTPTLLLDNQSQLALNRISV
ncbi:MAG: adenylate/guanylate cyclase domain-containing protein [Saprospiraceae bacterium]